MSTSSPAAEVSDLHPSHLDPSELGTKEYWDKQYESDIQAQNNSNGPICDPVDLESWFNDVGAPSKVLDFLSSKTFPLSPNRSDVAEGGEDGSQEPVPGASHASVLDIGTGNGSVLFTLRLNARYYGYMVGVDYSPRSVELARSLGRKYAGEDAEAVLSEDYEMPPDEFGCDKIRFEQFDVLRDDPEAQDWWPGSDVQRQGSAAEGSFDLVLDKGTFDAISLSSETVAVSEGKSARICELYPEKAINMVKPSGFLLITSCNWTEEEVIRWFTRGVGVEGRLEIFDRIKYPTFEFGGKKGQGVASVCFRRKKIEG